MIRRALFWRLSGFNPLIFAYCEDMDLCHRAHDIGQATHVVLEAQLVHHQGTAFRTRRASQRSRHLEGELIYVRGHWSGSATASYIALRGLQYLIKMLGEVMRDNRADQQVQSELLTLLTRTGLGFRFRRPVRRP
jgi:GT2 family glycosyltransferase